MTRPIPTDARCLDCNYVLCELTTDRCPECGRSFDAANPATYHRRGSLRLGLKYWAKPPSLWTIAPCVLLLLAMMHNVSCSGGTNGPYHVVPQTRVFPILAIVVVCDFLIRFAAVLRNRRFSGVNALLRCRRGRWRWFAFPVCVMLFASLFVYNWPLKIRFEMSRSALDDEVARFKVSGEPRYRRQWVGFYQVTTTVPANDDWAYDFDELSCGISDVWIYTGWWTFSGMMLHYTHGITFLYHECLDPPPEEDPGGGIYHPEIADPPWFVYY